jgi:hypothetical protein
VPGSTLCQFLRAPLSSRCRQCRAFSSFSHVIFGSSGALQSKYASIMHGPPAKGEFF